MSKTSRDLGCLALVLWLVALLVGCSSAGPKPDKKAPVLTPGAANVYLFRPPSTPVYQAFRIYVDGRMIGALPNRSYTRFHLEPGRHRIEYRDPYAPIAYVKRTIEVVPGKTHYLANISYGVGQEGPRPIIAGSSIVWEAGGPITQADLIEITPELAKDGMGRFGFVGMAEKGR
jgi:hypothetical protein